MNDHDMMAWENLEEPRTENDTEDCDSLEDEEHEQKNSKEEEKADDEF